jgi:hypothetical protein
MDYVPEPLSWKEVKSQCLLHDTTNEAADLLLVAFSPIGDAPIFAAAAAFHKGLATTLITEVPVAAEATLSHILHHFSNGYARRSSNTRPTDPT